MMTVPTGKAERQGGFTLVATLLILAAVTILVIGLFSLSSSEKTTATSFDAIQQAELAVQAGFSHAAKVLDTATRSEMNIIMKAYAGDDPEGRPRDLLMSAVFDPGVNNWVYTPFASGVNPPLSGGTSVPGSVPQLIQDTDFDGDGRSDPLPLEATRQQSEEELYALDRMDHPIPSRSVPPMYWETLSLPADGVTEEKVSARYSFFVEDLQANLSLERAGNQADPERRNGDVVAPVWTSTLHRRQLLDGDEDHVKKVNEYTTLTTKRHLVPGLTLREPVRVNLDEKGLPRDQTWSARMGFWERPLLSESALYTLQDSSVIEDSNLLLMDNQLIKNRNLLVTPWSWKEVLSQVDPVLPWPGMERERAFVRDEPLDSFSDLRLARVESSLMSGILPYDEAAIIPTYPGVIEGGQYKMNLNKMLFDIEYEQIGDEWIKRTPEKRDLRSREVVVEIANHIEDHLPEFAKGRRGGFPLGGPEEPATAIPVIPLVVGAQPAETEPEIKNREFAYLKTLAAGIIDYADIDPLPTIREGHYRGMDSYPIVSEQWQGYHAVKIDGNALIIRLCHYAEVWNMTNQPITGELQYAVECNGLFRTATEEAPIMPMIAGANGAQGELLDRKKLIDSKLLVAAAGRFWLKPVTATDRLDDVEQPIDTITLAPNEYRVIKWLDLDFRIPAGLTGATDRSFEFVGMDAAFSDLRSRYRLRFKPKALREDDMAWYDSRFVEVDWPLGPVERYTRRTVLPPTPTPPYKYRHFNTSLPGMSYGRNVTGYKNNLGDPRAAFFINFYQDVVNYDQGSSAWGRSFRSNVSGDQFHKENRIHLWPDTGHSTPPGYAPNSRPLLNDNSGGMEWADPSASKPSVPTPDPLKYVQYLSNRGRYFSVTELGHVFDPIMWAPYGAEPSDVTSPTFPQYQSYADIRAGSSTPSARFCGGNTLRIGRVEHARFRPDYRSAVAIGRPADRRRCATALLDLFHCGIPYPAARDPEEADEAAEARMMTALAGNLVRIDGHININTASYDVLRAVIAGNLVTDPAIVAQAVDFQKLHGTSTTHPDVAGFMARQIIANRPFISPAELPERVVEVNANPNQPNAALLGATTRATDLSAKPEWNDAAAEEVFARIFNSSTVRSRNFRIVVSGQAIRTRRSGETDVLASRSRLYHVFVRPIRNTDGVITSQKVDITYARSY